MENTELEDIDLDMPLEDLQDLAKAILKSYSKDDLDFMSLLADSSLETMNKHELKDFIVRKLRKLSSIDIFDSGIQTLIRGNSKIAKLFQDIKARGINIAYLDGSMFEKDNDNNDKPKTFKDEINKLVEQEIISKKEAKNLTALIEIEINNKVNVERIKEEARLNGILSMLAFPGEYSEKSDIVSGSNFLKSAGLKGRDERKFIEVHKSDTALKKDGIPKSGMIEINNDTYNLFKQILDVKITNSKYCVPTDKVEPKIDNSKTFDKSEDRKK